MGRERAKFKYLNSSTIAKTGEGLEKLHWLPTEHNIRAHWDGGDQQITTCTGEVTEPSVEDRSKILSEAHDSTVGGHKGIYNTNKRIRDQYFWPGMEKDIINYVRLATIV